MTIVTKYNIGDVVFTIFNNKIKTFKISAIFYSQGSADSFIEYDLYSVTGRVQEKELFKTKEELIANL